MRHFLVRHAHAVDLEPDAARPLSAKGHGQITRLAEFLGRSGAFAPDEIWHSPLVRARETAEALASRLRLEARLREVDGLLPEDDPVGVARRLVQEVRSIALVGHEPQLGAFASLLLAEPGRPTVVMRKAAVLALEGFGTHWQVEWMLIPELLP